MANPRSWDWKTGRPWWPDWVIDREAGTAVRLVERLEGIEVRVGAEEVGVGGLDHLGQHTLALDALAADLGEARAEDDRELRLGRGHLFEGVDGVPHEDDGEVDRATGHVVDGGHAHEPVELGPLRVDRRDGGAERVGPGPQLAPHARGGAPGRVGGADHGDRAGAEEGVEVDLTQTGGSTVQVGGVGGASGGRRHAADNT